jgi:hypothetical protein
VVVEVAVWLRLAETKMVAASAEVARQWSAEGCAWETSEVKEQARWQPVTKQEGRAFVREEAWAKALAMLCQGFLEACLPRQA